MSYLHELSHLGLGGIFLASFIIGLSGAIMPGPVLAVAITHTARRGFWAGPLIVLGHGLLELSLLAALAAGLAAWLEHPLVAGIIGAVGTAILLWMGWGMLRDLGGLSLDLSDGRGGGSGRGPVGDGVLLSLANPYFSIWWATVGLGLLAVVSAAGWGWAGVAAFYTGHILSDLAWYSLVSALVAGGRRFINDRVYRGLVGGCGLFLMVFALMFAAFAWRRLTLAWA